MHATAPQRPPVERGPATGTGGSRLARRQRQKPRRPGRNTLNDAASGHHSGVGAILVSFLGQRQARDPPVPQMQSSRFNNQRQRPDTAGTASRGGFIPGAPQRATYTPRYCFPPIRCWRYVPPGNPKLGGARLSRTAHFCDGPPPPTPSARRVPVPSVFRTQSTFVHQTTTSVLLLPFNHRRRRPVNHFNRSPLANPPSARPFPVWSPPPRCLVLSRPVLGSACLDGFPMPSGYV